MKALCTGAGGFLGGHLVHHLLDLGYQVRATDIKPFDDWWQYDDRAEGVAKVDLTKNCANCWQLFRCYESGTGWETDIDIVFHLAANMGGIAHITDKSQSAAILYDNTVMDAHLIENAYRAGVSKFLFTSSVCVYPMYFMEEPEYEPLKDEDVYPADPNECLLPGTVVVTRDGPIEIDKVEMGNRVITHEGRACRVRKTTNRDYDGDIIRLNSRMTSEDVCLTPSHPILIRRRIEGGRRVQYQDRLTWVRASEVCKGDALVIPIQQERRDIEIDDRLLMLAGIYVAEGSIDHKYYTDQKTGKRYNNGWRVAIWFGERCLELLDEIVSYLDDMEYGYTVYKHRSGLTALEIRGDIYEWLEQFGKGAQNKRIPSWLMSMPPKRQKIFMDAYLLGDGWSFVSKSGNQVVGAGTVSRTLAYQLFQLFLRGGLCPSLVNRGLMKGGFKERQIESRFDNWVVKVARRKNNSRSDWASWNDGKYYNVVLRSVEREPYSGTVYNLEVENDNSYCAGSGIAVHNCYGWAKLHTEHILTSFYISHGFQVYIPRLQNTWGTHTEWKGGREKAPAALCRKVAQAKIRGKPHIEVWGDGTQTRSFTHVSDVVKALEQLVHTDCHTPVTVGTDEYVTIEYLVGLICKAADYYPRVFHDESKPVGVMGRVFNHDKLRSVLGWVPETSVEARVEEVYRWVEREVRGGLRDGV